VRRIVPALAAGAVLIGCATSYRDRAIREFRDQLVAEGGLPRSVADCVVDTFFDGMDTAAVKDFFEVPELTDAESQQFAEIGEACATDR
jgi:hypothetical protein